jgi:hypothetical protein
MQVQWGQRREIFVSILSTQKGFVEKNFGLYLGR